MSWREIFEPQSRSGQRLKPEEESLRRWLLSSGANEEQQPGAHLADERAGSKALRQESPATSTHGQKGRAAGLEPSEPAGVDTHTKAREADTATRRIAKTVSRVTWEPQEGFKQKSALLWLTGTKALKVLP